MRSFELTQPNIPKKIIRYELLAGIAQDVYEKNYSTVKSTYGLDSLSDGTFTGDEIIGYDTSPATEIYTDTGTVLVNDTRYIDTRASVTILSIDTVGASVGTAQVDDAAEWLEVDSGDTCQRYLLSDIDATITLSFGPSLISSQPTETALLANLFPSWTDIYTDPDSLGQQFMNVFALDIEELKKQAITWPKRSYINEIPTGTKAFAYLSELPNTNYPINVIGNYDASPSSLFYLSPAEDIKEFLESESTQHIYWLDGRTIFTSALYDALLIDDVEYPQEKVIIRNFFDYIGDYLDLPRLADEENAAYKTRILDVYANPPGASVQRFEKAIERESGCTIQNVWELRDNQLPWETNNPATSGVFYPEPTEEHKDIAKWCREEGAVGFDYFQWSKALYDYYVHPWDLGEVPYLLDKTLSSLSTTGRAGIGWSRDLEVSPYKHTGTFNYSVGVKALGYLQTSSTIYPPVTVTGRLVPSATLSEYENEFSGYVSLKMSVGATIYYRNIAFDIPRDATHSANTNSWILCMPVFGDTQHLNGALSTDTTCTEVEIDIDTITEYRLYDGRWDFATGALVDNSPADQLTMKFTLAGVESSSPWTVASHSGDSPDGLKITNANTFSITNTSWEGTGSSFSVTCNANQAILAGSVDVPRNMEAISNLGTILYSLDVDSVSPSSATYTLVLSTGGTTHSGWIDNGATINLSSTYQESVDVFTPTEDDTELIFAGTLSTDSTIATHTVARADFGLAGNFVNGTYGVKVSGDVTARIANTIGATSDTLVVELNPVYMFEWAPLVYPGTVYLDGNEYLLHADEETETITGTSHILAHPLAPGLPLSLSEPLTEIHFTDAYGVPTLTVTQEIEGNGTRYLPLWYDNAVSITIEGVSKSLLVDNIVDNVTATTAGVYYTVAYQITDSYCIDYAHLHTDGQYLPEISLQASHPDITVTYTPYSDSGYAVDTNVATNPLFTTKNRDFLYIDDTTPSYSSVLLLTKPPILYRGETSPIFARVLDDDGNGIAGVTILCSGSDGQSDTDISDADGYVHFEIEGTDSGSPLPSNIEITVSDGGSPAIADTVTFDIKEVYYTLPGGIYLTEQTYQVAQTAQNILQTIRLLAIDNNGVPITTAGTYSIWCDNSSGIVTSTPISPNSNGVVTFTTTPAYTGRYVITFNIGIFTKEVGWELVERI